MYYHMAHLSSTHPINQHPYHERYAEMTHFVNHTTTKFKSKYSILNIVHVRMAKRERSLDKQ